MSTSRLPFACLAATTLLVAACGGSLSSESEPATSSAAASTAHPLCLVPSTAPENFNGEIWTLDESEVERATSFYWHGVPFTLGGDPPVAPAATFHVDRRDVEGAAMHVEGAAMHVEATQIDGADASVVIDLTFTAGQAATAWWNRTVKSGVLRVVVPGKPDETIDIRWSEGCR